MPEAILGISAFYHDSAAAILVDGEIIAAAHEERFTRHKHDSSFPRHAARYVLEEAGIPYDRLQAVVFYDKPYVKFERLLETYHAFAPRGLSSFMASIPLWIREKLFTKTLLRNELARLGSARVPLLFSEHHLSHAASAYYPSPFEEAAILTIDGVGEWATSTVGHGKGRDIEILREQTFPHSLGLLYSAFTYYIGFKVNSGEYKLMGLAPYGNKNAEETKRFKNAILEHLVDVRDDGSVLLNMKFFRYATGLRMCHDQAWEQLFGLAPRQSESELSQPYMNLALAIQEVTEEVMLRLAKTAKELTGSKRLVLAGGVALNSVANGKLLAERLFEEIWIQPASGDAGGSLGAALVGWHIWKSHERRPPETPDAMKGAYLGPEYGCREVERTARKYGAPCERHEDFGELAALTAKLISEGNVIGWFQGRMEYGPRALGNRSILGDPRDPEMQKRLNLKIKYREGFRPFAPTVLEEDIQDYFDLDVPSPYMLLVVPVKESRRKPLPEGYEDLELYPRLYHLRSDIPAVTHIDYSARVQSVSKSTNPKYWRLIDEFKKLTGYGIIVNTSFNVRGEPIVCTPDDAYRCFMRTEMDYLVAEDYVFDKRQQPKLEHDVAWRDRFQLD